MLPADAADEAVWVVRPPQGRYHLSSDVLVTAVTLGPVEPLVVLCTDVLARVVEETRAHQITAAHCADGEKTLNELTSLLRNTRPNREKTIGSLSSLQ